MIWIKYRNRTSASSGDWEYLVFPKGYENFLDWTKSPIELGRVMVDEGIITDAPNWSEHYRGTEAERIGVEDVPQEEIERFMTEANDRALGYAERWKMLNLELVRKLESEQGKSATPTNEQNIMVDP
jgi:hypothetical protein